jgi:prepilin-type N-terminal cleavage/methylation domain-containing protein
MLKPKSYWPNDLLRGGFTLVELLVALTVLLILTTILIGFGSRLMESRRSNSGADSLQKWLLIAKQRALRDRTPTGLWIRAQDPGDQQIPSGTFAKFSYVQQPPDIDFSPAQISLTTSTNGMGPPPYDIAALSGGVSGNDFYGPFGAGAYQNIQAGDYLQLNNGRLNQVVSVTDATHLNILNTLMTGNTTPPDTMQTATSAYKFIRAPRPLQGEDDLKLPQDVVVDGNLSAGIPANQRIIFGPDGRITGPAANSGKIIFWVRDFSQGNAEESLIVTYTRTGFIAAHPVATQAITSCVGTVSAGTGVTVTITTSGAIAAGSVLLLQDSSGYREFVTVTSASGTSVTLAQVNNNYINPWFSDPFAFTRDGRTSGS